MTVHERLRPHKHATPKVLRNFMVPADTTTQSSALANCTDSGPGTLPWQRWMGQKQGQLSMQVGDCFGAIFYFFSSFFPPKMMVPEHDLHHRHDVSLDNKHILNISHIRNDLCVSTLVKVNRAFCAPGLCFDIWPLMWKQHFEKNITVSPVPFALSWYPPRPRQSPRSVISPGCQHTYLTHRFSRNQELREHFVICGVSGCLHRHRNFLLLVVLWDLEDSPTPTRHSIRRQWT